MTTLEALKAARAKISDEKNWTQELIAVDSCGNDVPATDSNACRWCAMGALVAVGGEGGWRWPIYGLLDELSGVGSFTLYNDTHTHAEVLGLFDKAITSLETEVSQ